MANRQEFTRDVRAEIARRAQVPTGFRCEGCGAIVLRFEIHHVKQDAMKTEDEKRKRLTAKDGLLLCIPCHAVESGRHWPFASVDSTDIAQNHNRPQNTPRSMVDRWDAMQCSGRWVMTDEQRELLLMAGGDDA